jgi:RHS repeat-associated protein
MLTTEGTEHTENYEWDGLALIRKNSTSYTNEPAVTGGNAILATNNTNDTNLLFNDMLGTTLGVIGSKDERPFASTAITAFGETTSKGTFFTGKPQVEGLGYAFLFRNYRAGLGKWQTADPLGYPDGWNNLAYVNNDVTSAIDWLGGETENIVVTGKIVVGCSSRNDTREYWYDGNTTIVRVTTTYSLHGQYNYDNTVFVVLEMIVMDTGLLCMKILLLYMMAILLGQQL